MCRGQFLLRHTKAVIYQIHQTASSKYFVVPDMAGGSSPKDKILTIYAHYFSKVNHITS